MASLVQQSTTQLALKFFMVLTADHISPATGLSPTVTIRKEGATFGSPAGAVTEIANGWYQVAANATDTNTLGDIILHAIAATADNFDGVVAQVVAFNPQNANLGMTNVSANVAQVNGSSTGVSSLSGTIGNIGRGTCTTGGSTTSVPTSAFSPGGAGIVSGQFIGRTIIFDGNTTTAALQGQATNITANTSGATPTFTVTALTTAPSAGDTFSVV